MRSRIKERQRQTRQPPAPSPQEKPLQEKPLQYMSALETRAAAIALLPARLPSQQRTPITALQHDSAALATGEGESVQGEDGNQHLARRLELRTPAEGGNESVQLGGKEELEVTTTLHTHCLTSLKVAE